MFHASHLTFYAPRTTHHAPRATHHASRFTPHFPLFLILLIFTALTLYQSIILPLGEADDETDHYQYLRFVARTGHPPLTGAERREAGFKGGLAPLYYWLTAWPVALVGENALPDIRRTDARPERLIPGDGLGLNHVLHTLDEQWPWRGQVLAWHLVRLLSLPPGWVTIVAAYLLARRLQPEPKIIAVGAAAFIAFLPRFVISSAAINDDNLVFALTALLLLIQVIILQAVISGERVSPRLFAIFGILLGLTLLTKYFSLILIPEVIFTLVMYQVAGSKVAGSTLQANQRPGSGDRQFAQQATGNTFYISPLLAFLAAFSLTAGPWFIFIMLRFNRIGELGLIPGLAASLGEPQITEGLVGLLSGQAVRPVAATYSLPEWFSLLYRSFWFEFGWMQLFAPAWIYTLFTFFLFLTLLGYVLRFTPHASRITFQLSPISSLLTLHAALFLVVVLARYVLSATIDTGQGRHLYPALPVIALFISLGLFYFGFTIFSRLPAHLLPRLTRRLPAHHLPFTIYYLPFTLLYLLPAAGCLLWPALILTHYRPLPVTITPPEDLPVTYRHSLEFAPGLSFAGFDLAPAATAGEALPVTLYWRAEQEAPQDYLLSLCVQDEAERPVACWAGHFAGGHYPARAWEAGDTLADTVFIPIPACSRLPAQTYRLHLEVWPLQPDSSQPKLAPAPVLRRTFDQPPVSIRPAAAPLTRLPQPFELWRGGQRLAGPVAIRPAEALTWVQFAGHSQRQRPAFIRPATGVSQVWSPLPELATPSFLPCEDGPGPVAHLAHFVAGPDLPPGPYFPNEPGRSPQLTLSLDLRQRTFAPLTSTLVFTPYLALLSLELPEQPAISFLAEGDNSKVEEISSLPAFPSSRLTLHPARPSLPVTLRWQARRWMAGPLMVSLKLLDKDFQVGGERVATLGGRYPNVLWAPGEVVEETYPLQLKAGAPPGLYRLEISVLRPDKNLADGYEYLPLSGDTTTLGHNLYPATFRLLDPADGASPPQPFSAQLGDSIRLTGYDLSPKSKIQNLKSKITLALYWQSTAKIPTGYTVFTQLVGPDGQVWAQWDNPPQAGRYPTTAWADQDSVVDRYTLTLGEGAPPGDYRLLVGMYDPASGQRLPATVNGQPQADNAILLTTLTVDY